MRKSVDVDALARRLAREYRLSLDDALLILNLFTYEDMLTSSPMGRRFKVEHDRVVSDKRPVIEQLTEEFPQFATPAGQATLRAVKRMLSSTVK